MRRLYFSFGKLFRNPLSQRSSPRKPIRRLGIETLEDRTVPSGTPFSTVSGVAFVDSNGSGAYQSQDFLLPGVSVTLSGTTSTGTSVGTNTQTDSSGSYSFTSVQPGSYQLTYSSQPDLQGDPATGNANTSDGTTTTSTFTVGAGQTLTENIAFGGLSPQFITLSMFLNTSTSPGSYPLQPAGSGPAPVSLPTASSLGFTTAGQTLTAGQDSGTITLQLQDQLGNAFPEGGDVIDLTTSNSSTGKFFASAGSTTAITTVTTDTNGQASFVYSDTTAGAPTITATDVSNTSLTPITQTETISAAAASKVSFTTSPQTFATGTDSGPITVQIQDQFGNAVAKGGDTINLSRTSSTGQFFASASSTTPITSVTTASNGSASFVYSDSTAGSPTLTATDATTPSLTAGTQTETIQTPAATKIVFSTGPQTTTAGTDSGTITVQVQDQFGNAFAENGDTINLTSTSSAGKFFANGSSTTAITSVTTGSTGAASFVYSDTTAGTPTITATDATKTSVTAGTQKETITAASALKVGFSTTAQSVVAGTDSGTITVQVQDTFGNAVSESGDTINLTSSSGTGQFFASASSTTPITSVTTGSNGAASFAYSDTKAGSPTITATDATNPSLTAGTQTQTVTAAAVLVTPIPAVSGIENTSNAVDLDAYFGAPTLQNTTVQFNTSDGSFDVELFNKDAPKTAANFLAYAESGSYTSSIFHRETSGSFAVIQGGGFALGQDSTTSSSISTINIPFPSITTSEFNDTTHPLTTGTLALATTTSGAGTNEWFFNLQNNNSVLSGGSYTVFGQLADGSGNLLTDSPVLDKLAAAIPVDESAPTGNSALTNLPLQGGPNGSSTGTFSPSDPNFPADAKTSNFDVVTSVQVLTPKSALTYSATSSNTALVTPTISGNMLNLPYVAGQTGSATITVTATDPFGNQTVTTFQVTVSAPPTVTAAPVTPDNPAATKTLTVTPTPPNGASAYTYQWLQTSAGGSTFQHVSGLTQANQTLTLPTNLAAGTYEFEVLVTPNNGTASAAPTASGPTFTSTPVTITSDGMGGYTFS